MPFHAGLDPSHKRKSLTRFRSGEPLVVVATIAFGMGIDRPDVRFVVHLDMPDSPEAYYQQIGRAGRDGDPADTLLLYGGQDVAQARHWLAQSAAPEARKRVMRTKLEEMVALTEAVTCRTRSLLTCFGEALDVRLRPLRQLRGAAGHRGCLDRGADGAFGGLSDGSDLRCRAYRGRAARREDRGGAAASARHIAHVRGWGGTWRRVLAGADPPVDRAPRAGRRYRGSRRPVPGAGGGSADPARRGPRHAAAGSASSHADGPGRSVGDRWRCQRLAVVDKRIRPCTRRCGCGGWRRRRVSRSRPT